MEFYNKLQQIRKENGMSQEALADRLGVSRQAVSKWENGQGFPETDKLLQMSNIFGVSLDYLLKDEQPQTAEGEPDDGTYYANREMVESFLLAKRQKALQTVLGVVVLIVGFSWHFLLDEPYSIMMFFLFAAVGVGILVMNGFRAKRYAPEMEERALMFDSGYSRELKNRYQTVRRNNGIKIVAGIATLILGVATNVFFSEVRILPEERMGAILFLFIAVGVGLIIYGTAANNAWEVVAENEKYIKDHRESMQYGWVYGITMTLATILFFVFGFVYSAWHPGWLAFLGGALLGTFITGIMKYAGGR